jgi:acyl-homoserine lactone acylase PvdQ
VFADQFSLLDKGDIGYIAPGKIPIRKEGHSGNLSL